MVQTNAYEAIDTKDPAMVTMENEEGMSETERRFGIMKTDECKWGAKHPSRFKTLEFKSNHPEMTNTQLARKLKITRMTVIRHLKPVNLKIQSD